MNYEASEDDENSCTEMVYSIRNDLDVCSTSANNVYNKLNLTPNPLNEEASTTMYIPIHANVGAIQLHKAQLYLKTNESCGLKRNELCVETEARMKLE